MTVQARKGIVLATGNAWQLYPATAAVPKYVLPLYDKPLVYYPLSTLMLAGLVDILVIAQADAQALLQRLLGDGRQWGIALSYAAPGGEQPCAAARRFLGHAHAACIPGDLVLFGHGLEQQLASANCRESGATMFAAHVADASGYPVVRCDAGGAVRAVEDGQERRAPNDAATGLYFYDNHVCDNPCASLLDINRAYLAAGTMSVQMLGRGTAWLGTDSSDAWLDAARFIAAIEKRQGLKIAVPEEIAYRRGLIGAAALERLAHTMKTSGYGHYLRHVLYDKVF